MDATIERTQAADAADLSRHLAGARYLTLTTFRRSGEPVATPVWFALAGDRAYVVTDDPSGKVKRIRHTARVRVAPSTWRGRAIGGEAAASARIIADQAEQAAAERALRERYGWQWRAFSWFSERFRHRGDNPVRHVFLAITAA